MKLFRHPEDRRIFRLAIPALGALAADPLYSLIDTAFVGNLGTTELGALAVATAAFTASFWIFSFLAYGVTPRVARTFGTGDAAGASRVGVQALYLACVLGAVTSVVGLFWAGPIVRLFGATGDVTPMAESYLRIRILAVVPVLVAQVGQGWMRGMQDTKTPMIVMSVGLAINTVLNYVLIYPVGLGVNGSAIATVIGQIVAALAFAILLLRRMERPVWRPDLGEIRTLLTVGVELAVRTGSLLAGLTVATAVAARMGEVELAGWQIAMQVFLLLALSLDSLAIAAQALVGRYLGSGDPARASMVGRRLMTLGIGLGFILFAILGIGSRWGASLFTQDDRVVAVAASLLLWVAVIQPLSAVAFTLDGILIGASDTRFLAVAMVGASAVYIAGSWISLEARWGVDGLAAATTVWLAVRALSTGSRFIRGRWAKPATEVV